MAPIDENPKVILVLSAPRAYEPRAGRTKTSNIETFNILVNCSIPASYALEKRFHTPKRSFLRIDRRCARKEDSQPHSFPHFPEKDKM
jgi:hypothetical protein